MSKVWRQKLIALLVGAFVVPMLAGCPSNGTAKVTTLFTGSSSVAKVLAHELTKQGGTEVPIEDIESLYLTIDQIVLVPSGEVDEEDGEEGEGEGSEAKQDDVPSSHVLVFDGEMRVDITDLLGVSEVLSSADIPANTYGQLRLSVSEPEVVLTGSEPMENIQLTANGRLFVTQTIEIPEGQDSLLVIDFGGVKLNQLGNGDFVLTPQLDVDVSVTDANVMVMGSIVSVNTDDDTMVVSITDSGDEVTVDYSGAQILLPDMMTVGDETNLTVGSMVDVSGTMMVDGSVTADTVQLL